MKLIVLLLFVCFTLWGELQFNELLDEVRHNFSCCEKLFVVHNGDERSFAVSVMNAQDKQMYAALSLLDNRSLTEADDVPQIKLLVPAKTDLNHMGEHLVVASLYHELAHVHFNDHLINFYALPHSLNFIDIVTQAGFQIDLESIGYYLQVGRRYVELPMTVGDGYLDDRGVQTIQAYYRSRERRADYYALKLLWAHEKYDFILAQLGEYLWLNEDQSEFHPASIERACYIAGFLIDHGFDLINNFKLYETRLSPYLEELRATKGAQVVVTF